MIETISFNEVVEAADRLTPDEQQELVDILRRRLAQEGRRRIASDIEASRREYAAGNCKVSSPADLMREILK
jgi:pyruvate/2-oxoglutarate dehydrogenase complex dihydrolipoamide dehydrogenase (E3) component